MSQRYGPTSDTRFSRDRSPPRGGAPGLHPSRATYTDSRPKDALPAPVDAPRGPRASTDSFRPYGHPRGRGIGRGDFRPDFRDREAFRRDASPPGTWRDFRGGRARSPTADRYPPDTYRDFHDHPREFEFGRGRGRYRETASSRFGEGRGALSYYPARDETSRGRGQFSHSRGRGRGFHEDRGGFRTRSRSPPPPPRTRWDRSLSPPARRPPVTERLEESRSDHRGSEKSYDRDDRSRDEDKGRAERQPPGSTPAPSQLSRPVNSQAFNANRSVQEPERDISQLRRIPSAPDMGGGRERVYDSFRPEPSTKREATATAQLSSRPSSPPRAPQVPAFGSLPPKTTGIDSAPWNKWIAPEQKQPHHQQQQQAAPISPLPPQSPSSANEAKSDRSPLLPSQPATPTIPTSSQTGSGSLQTNAAPRRPSPRPQPLDMAPKAPKAQRRDVSPAGSETSASKVQLKLESPKTSARSVTQSIESTPNIPTAPAPTPVVLGRDAPPLAVPSAPTGPKQLSGVPAGPKASLSPLVARTALSSPGFNPPSGPRAGPVSSPTLPPSVPTGPRAERAVSVNARPPFAPSGPASWQWNRVEVPPLVARGTVIPAKRKPSGGRRDFGARPFQDQAHNTLSTQSGVATMDEVSDHRDADREPSKRPKLEPQDTVEEGKEDSNDPKAVESASEEDAMDIDDDSARRENAFLQNKARLEARKLDLSARRLRGTSPLRQLNLLASLSLEDLAIFFEAPPPRARKSTTQRVVSQQSPKSLGTTDLQDELSGAGEPPVIAQSVLRLSRPTKPEPKLSPSPVGSPELRSLPFLHAGPPTPFSDREELQDNLKRHELLQEILRNELYQRSEDAADEDAELCDEYEHHYRVWRQHVKYLDAEQKTRDEVERQDPSEQAVFMSTAEVSPPLQTPAEGRRRGLHATDYELEKVLEMSKLEAEREAQEKRERDAAHAKPNWELEAVTPKLLPPQDAAVHHFADASCLRDPKQMVMTWDLVPPEDDFTQEEHDTMLQNFKDFPKKFGKIAEGLPDRSYKECINHYYATKWDGKYKPPRDKRRKLKVSSGRRRDVRPRANALISNLNEDAKPDLYDGDDAIAPLNAYTESGRPKRAAAPIFKDKDVPGEQPSLATPIKKPSKGEQGERAAEKSGRKPRIVNKEARPRKPRIQAAPRRDSRSPEKLDVDLNGLERLQPSARDLEGANSLAALGGATQPIIAQRPTNAPAFVVEPSQSRAAVAAEAGKISAVKSGHHASGTSSYWSVQEVEMFPQLISKYGTDWTSIASEMGSKTHTMVKNYFSRLSNKKPEIKQVAEAANRRREEGGERVARPLSTPGASNKRLKDSGPVSQSRSIAPTSASTPAEVIDLDEDEHAAPNSGTGRPPRTSLQDTVKPPFSPPDPVFARALHGQSGGTSQPFSSAAFSKAIPSYAPVNQPIFEPRSYAPRDPIVTTPTPAASQYAPISRPMEFGPVSNVPPVQASMGRPSYQPVGPGIEDVLYRTPLRPVQPIAAADSPAVYGQTAPGPSPTTRPLPAERMLSDDIHHTHQHMRRPSPQPLSAFRHLMEQPSSRPQSTTYLEHVRSTGPPAAREEMVMSGRTGNEKPPQPPAPSKPEGPRRSNLMSILNDEPSDPPPRPAPSNHAPPGPSNNPTPPQYGAIPASSYQVQRPSSRIERGDAYPPSHEHSRNPSLSGFQPYHPHAHQHARPHPDARTAENAKLHPSTFHLQWPLTEDARPPPEPAVRLDHRASLRHIDNRYNPSPPPAYGSRDVNPGSGHNSPFTQRIPLQHLTGRVDSTHIDPSPPPGRSYAYAPPPSHSRDASIQHLNPERRAPPPSVLQPQHTPQTRMQPQVVSREPPPLSREYMPYPPHERERPLYSNREAPVQNPGLEPAYDDRRIWGAPRDFARDAREPVLDSMRDPVRESVREQPMRDSLREAIHEPLRRDDERNLLRREDERALLARENDRQDDRRAVDWTQGLRSESRYGHAASAERSAPQYAPYQPMERREPERGH